MRQWYTGVGTTGDSVAGRLVNATWLMTGSVNNMKTSISGQCDATKMLPETPWRAERCWQLVGTRDPGPGK